MKVKELISDLSTYNPEAKVTFCTDDDDLVILSIYSGDLKKDSAVYDKESDPETDPDVIFDLGDEGSYGD